MKRIVTVQDISCVGRCSLTVALPIISAMGVETSVLPTAVLSSHTLFPHPAFCDLTGEIPAITAHWREIGVTFHGIYTGYLGSLRQLVLISDFIDEFRGDGFVFIDPVMGDHGRLYSGFTDEFVSQMRQFCGKGGGNNGDRGHGVGKGKGCNDVPGHLGPDNNPKTAHPVFGGCW